MFNLLNEDEKAIIYLYGVIGKDFWDEESSNTAKSFSKTLDELKDKPIEIHIDSVGGDVYEGFAIASAIQRYKGETTAFIDGIAASAASYVALMADKVIMADFAEFMIHNAWTMVSGNSSDLLAMAERLDALDLTIARIISARTGMELTDVQDAMKNETWYNAEDAKDNGFADEVIQTEKRAAASLDKTILSHFKNVPESISKSHAENNLNKTAKKLTVLGNRVVEL